MRQRSLVPIITGGSIFAGLVFYSTRPGPRKTPVQHRRDAAEAKKAEGLGGAGIGGNAMTGGHELSAKTDRPTETSPAPREKLPDGGVGGGVGAGGSNVRKNVEMSVKKVAGTSSSGADVSGSLGGLFGTGGRTAGEGTDPETKDTRVASNHDKTPTKRNAGAEHYHHQPRVPKPNTPKDSDNSPASGSPQDGD
ncbi:Fc.00g008230.m01.CDS01 [Cosmosporella sp. VM-42]